MIKVAMIDDNTTVLMVTQAMLKKQGSIAAEDTFDKYQDPDLFLESIQNSDVNAYDAIIVDYDLGPGKPKGTEIVSRLQKEGFFGKAILLTGDDSIGTALRVKASGDIEFVLKNIVTGSGSTTEILGRLLADVRNK
jgi:FixJ family two-component response regulator